MKAVERNFSIRMVTGENYTDADACDIGIIAVAGNW